MNSETRPAGPRPVVVTPVKSVGIQILLVVLLGPLGLFYSTIKGALIMLFGVPLVLVLLVTATGLAAARGAGVGTMVALGSEMLLTLLVWWVGSFIWGIVAVNSYNRRLLQASA